MTSAAGSLLCALLAPCAALSAPTCVALTAPPPLPADLVAQAHRANDFPGFCSIPAIPTDVRGADVFKTSVVATRVAGARLVRQTGPETWSIDGTDDFAAGARGQATPPPPMTTPGEADTQAFVKAMKARATPPSRPR